MLVMVTFVGLLIFIYSTGYMAHDENYTRFFCFLSLFAGAMLGVVIANSLLLLFMCWELVGLTSYLLIGFWYQKPSAAAAAKKAFLTTRVGDVFFLLGIVWLFAQTGTLLSSITAAPGSMEAGCTSELLSGAVGVWAFRGNCNWPADLCRRGRARADGFRCMCSCRMRMEGPTPVSAPDSCGHHGGCRGVSHRARVSADARRGCAFLVDR